MNPIFEFTELIVKTGVLFANCDGKFDNREEQFVQTFTNGLLQEQAIDTEYKNHLISMSKKCYTFESVIEDTARYLSSFNEVERTNFKDVLKKFIEELIAADSEYASQEIDLYERWKKEVLI